MDGLENSCRCRLSLIATAAALWVVSLGADLVAWAGWAGPEAKSVAFYAIVGGILSMILTVFVCGYDLQCKNETQAANTELLEGGVVLIAILLFTINVAVRLRYPESTLPVGLSVLGIAAVFGEFWLDLLEAPRALRRRRSS